MCNIHLSVCVSCLLKSLISKLSEILISLNTRRIARNIYVLGYYSTTHTYVSVFFISTLDGRCTVSFGSPHDFTSHS